MSVGPGPAHFGVGWIPAWYSFRRVGVQAGGLPAAGAWMIAPLDLGKVGEAIPSHPKARNPYCGSPVPFANGVPQAKLDVMLISGRRVVPKEGTLSLG